MLVIVMRKAPISATFRCRDEFTYYNILGMWD